MPPALPSLSLPSCFPFFSCLYPHTFCTTAEGRGKEEKALPPPVLVACLHPRDSLPRSWDRQLLSLRHRRSCLFLRNAVTERKVLRRKGGDRKRALFLPPTKATRQLGGGEERKARRGGMWQQLPVPTEYSGVLCYISPTDRPSSFALSESKRGRRENKKHSRFPWVTYFLFRRQADYRTYRCSTEHPTVAALNCNGVLGN